MSKKDEEIVDEYYIIYRNHYLGSDSREVEKLTTIEDVITEVNKFKKSASKHLYDIEHIIKGREIFL
jgi:hypothetical protein